MWPGAAGTRCFYPTASTLFTDRQSSIDHRTEEWVLSLKLNAEGEASCRDATRPDWPGHPEFVDAEFVDTEMFL